MITHTSKDHRTGLIEYDMQCDKCKAIDTFSAYGLDHLKDYITKFGWSHDKVTKCDKCNGGNK